MAARRYVMMGQFGPEMLAAETPKAICLDVAPWEVNLSRPLWVPRSQCRVETPNPQIGALLYVAEWLIRREGLSYRGAQAEPEGATVPQPFEGEAS